MCFFSRFFAKADLPLWYAYATFAVLLISSLTGYFFNYRQIVLTADQKDYMLNSVVQSIKTIKVILQIFAIAYFSYGYIGWIALEFLASIITVFSIKHTLKKEYPWLTANPENGKTLRKKYPQIITKTKQLFFRKTNANRLKNLTTVCGEIKYGVPLWALQFLLYSRLDFYRIFRHKKQGSYHILIKSIRFRFRPSYNNRPTTIILLIQT